uniref:Speriolin C-terminal domain-containing protein n=1 Tax=Terrapene triunguis TaxID=2587831 RepID=A0A674I7U6_9SAUR
MTEDNEWMKTIQNENAYLKNQVRLLRENYELRSLLCQHYENSNEGRIVPSHPAPVYPNTCSPGQGGKENLDDLVLNAPDLLSQPQPSSLGEFVSSNPLSISNKEGTQAQLVFPGYFKTSEPFSPGIPPRKPVPLINSARDIVGEKMSLDLEEMHRKKRVWFSESPGGDEPRKPHTYYLNELDKFTEDSKKNGRIVGEIAFQLDRRILAYVFPGVTRLYGYTVSNIPEKIKQASMKCLDGSMDEKKHRGMMQRYLSLAARLEKMGYNRDVHPVFSEFLINTYGILKQRPDLHSSPLHSSPADLRKIVIDIVPSKFLGDTLLLLNCLCELSKEDSKPLFAW